MSSKMILKLSAIGMAVSIMAGCANQLNVPSSTRVKVYENPNSKYTQSKVLVPGEKFSEKSNFVIVDVSNSEQSELVRFVADNGSYVEVLVSVVAKIKDDPKSIDTVANEITPSILDSRGIPFENAWGIYGSNAVKSAVVNFFNKSENQNITSSTSISLEKEIKDSVANTPVEIKNVSVLRNIIKKPLDNHNQFNKDYQKDVKHHKYHKTK